jgi:hypothetical protein
MGGGGLAALDMYPPPSSVPVQIFDLEGSLLAEAAVPTTREAAVPCDGDVLTLILQGRELPGFGPTSVPTLGRLAGSPVAAGNGTLATAAPPREPDDGHDAPSGSALSTLDAVALFGDVGQRQFARS